MRPTLTFELPIVILPSSAYQSSMRSTHFQQPFGATSSSPTEHDQSVRSPTEASTITNTEFATGSDPSLSFRPHLADTPASPIANEQSMMSPEVATVHMGIPNEPGPSGTSFQPRSAATSPVADASHQHFMHPTWASAASSQDLATDTGWAQHQPAPSVSSPDESHHGCMDPMWLSTIPNTSTSQAGELHGWNYVSPSAIIQGMNLWSTATDTTGGSSPLSPTASMSSPPAIVQSPQSPLVACKSPSSRLVEAVWPMSSSPSETILSHTEYQRQHAPPSPDPKDQTGINPMWSSSIPDMHSVTRVARRPMWQEAPALSVVATLRQGNPHFFFESGRTITSNDGGRYFQEYEWEQLTAEEHEDRSTIQESLNAVFASPIAQNLCNQVTQELSSLRGRQHLLDLTVLLTTMVTDAVARVRQSLKNSRDRPMRTTMIDNITVQTRLGDGYSCVQNDHTALLQSLNNKPNRRLACGPLAIDQAPAIAPPSVDPSFRPLRPLEQPERPLLSGTSKGKGKARAASPSY